MIAIDWDTQRVRHGWQDWSIDLYTGVSVQVKNRLAVLRITGAADDADWAEQRLGAMLNSIPRYESGFVPNIPDIHYARIPTARGPLELGILWAVLWQGGVRGKQRLGTYRFVICTFDEIDPMLSQVFRLEDTLTPESR